MYLLPLLLTFILITLALILKKRNSPNLPPSPWKLPILGHLHHLLHSDAVPPRTLRKLSGRYGPIMHLKLGQVDHIVISSAEAAKEILKTHDLNFASRPQLIAPTVVLSNRDIVFAPYGSYWRQLRKISVLELLSARRVKTFSSIREGESSALMNRIMSAGESQVNLSEMFLVLANNTTALAAFGAECKHSRRFITETKKAVALISGFLVLDLFPSLGFFDGMLGTTAGLERMRSQFDEVLEEIIEEHQVKKSIQDCVVEDLVDVLLRVKDEGGVDFPLTMADIKSVTISLFIAGTDTMATTLTWVMAELIKNPMVMKKAQAEVRQAVKGKGVVEEVDIEMMYYMKLVIKETLRLHTPVPLLVPRVCQDTCTIGDYEIPAGSRVMINAWAIARDPDYWENAESFEPERFDKKSLDLKAENFHYLPFGGGRRVCPGMGFGLASVEFTLAQLLFHFDWELPTGKEVDMTESCAGSMVMKSDLCLVATPRFPLPGTI